MTAHDTVIAGGLVVTPEDLDKRAEREGGRPSLAGFNHRHRR